MAYPPPRAEHEAVVGYAYPWDVVGDPSFISRALDLGITRVALAAAYHTTRAATPLHPERRLMDARTAALYRPVRRSAWEGHRLTPAFADWVGVDDPFGQAAAELDRAGIAVDAWIVLTHASGLGTAHPDVTVTNCFGEPYPYALCPQATEVRDYASTLAAEAVRDAPVSGVVLEACGQLGLTHGGHHDKTDGAYDQDQQRWLSVCCCAACRDAWQQAGLDPDAVVGALRARTSIGARADDDLSADVASALLAARHRATDDLRGSVVTAVRAASDRPLRIALHGQPDPWATGALPGLTPTTADEVDVVVAPCWPTDPSSAATMSRLATELDDRATAGAYVTVLPPVRPDEVTSHVTSLVEAGARQLHLYHLGLVGPDRLPLLARAVDAAAAVR